MTTYWLKIMLKSDTAFGRGDGIAGLIDAEVQHDEHGLPFLSGKTLKGLMTATCAEIISALDSSKGGHLWAEVAHSLLGVPGHLATHVGNLHIGDALLPPDLRKAIAYERSRANNRLSREEVLNSLTTVRRQTAIDPTTGAPLDHSLRTIRVILRETTFLSRIDFVSPPNEPELKNQLALLTAIAKGLRRAGTNRNRGLGRVHLQLFDRAPLDEETHDITDQYFNYFRQEVLA